MHFCYHCGEKLIRINPRLNYEVCSNTDCRTYFHYTPNKNHSNQLNMVIKILDKEEYEYFLRQAEKCKEREALKKFYMTKERRV